MQKIFPMPPIVPSSVALTMTVLRGSTVVTRVVSWEEMCVLAWKRMGLLRIVRTILLIAGKDSLFVIDIELRMKLPVQQPLGILNNTRDSALD
jgi:hypothetical protein